MICTIDEAPEISLDRRNYLKHRDKKLIYMAKYRKRKKKEDLKKNLVLL